MWEIAKKLNNVRILGCSPTVGRGIRSSLGDWRVFPRCDISVTFFHKDLETNILVHGDDFSEYEADQQHVSSAFKALGLTNVKGVVTPGTDDVDGPKASKISELRRTAQFQDPPEEIKEEDDLLAGEELKLFQSVAARFNFLAMDRPDLLFSEVELGSCWC